MEYFINDAGKQECRNTQQTMIRLKDVFDVSFAFHEVSIGLETCFMRVLRVSLSPFLKRVSLKPNGNVSERFQ